MKEEEIKKLNIYEKMLMITDEIGVIEKNLKIDINKTRSYKAVSERDVLDGVKPLEKKYRVFSYPTSRKIVSTETLEKTTDYGTSTSLFMRVETTYKFVNIDKPEDFIETTVYGDGIDTGDKAPGKAMTYVDKYALMKAYKLSTGDDPDKEASPETGYKKAEKKATEKQIELLEKYYKGENLTKLLSNRGAKSLSDLSMYEASEIIKKIMDKAKADSTNVYTRWRR